MSIYVCVCGGFPWYLFSDFLFFWLGKSYRQSQKQQKIASNVLNRIINTKTQARQQATEKEKK